eukprot:5747853-Prymnesium_polylepis.1
MSLSQKVRGGGRERVARRRPRACGEAAESVWRGSGRACGEAAAVRARRGARGRLHTRGAGRCPSVR